MSEMLPTNPFKVRRGQPRNRGSRRAWRRRTTLLSLPGLSGVAGLLAADPQTALVMAVAAWVLAVAGDLLLQKRRDDVLAITAREGETKIALIRALTIHEAVRSGQLASEDIVKILKPTEGKVSADVGALERKTN